MQAKHSSIWSILPPSFGIAVSVFLAALKVADYFGNMDALINPPQWLNNPLIIFLVFGGSLWWFWHITQASNAKPLLYTASGHDAFPPRYSRRNVVVVSIAVGLLAFTILLVWSFSKRPALSNDKSERLIPAPALTPTPDLLHGVLIPAIEPMPISDCPFWPDATVLFLGDSVFFTDERLVAVRVDGNEIISFKETPAGIYVSANLYSKTNKVIARITDNEMFVNPGNLFQSKRPDWHTLIITDNTGEEVLHASYVNKRAIKILGTFSAPTLESPVVIEEHMLNICTSTFKRACMGQPGGTMLECKDRVLRLGSPK